MRITTFVKLKTIRDAKLFMGSLAQLKENMTFYQCNKVLMIMCINFHYECWKKTCTVLQESNMQRAALENERRIIIKEDN